MFTCSLCSFSGLDSRPRGSLPSPSPTRQALHPSKWPTRAAWPPSPPRPSHRSPCRRCPLPFRTCPAASLRRRTSSPSSASEVRAEGDVNTRASWRRCRALMLEVFMETTFCFCLAANQKPDLCSTTRNTCTGEAGTVFVAQH